MKSNRTWNSLKSQLAERDAWGERLADTPESEDTEQQGLPTAPERAPDAERERRVRQALTRFTRNKNAPEEQETLRYNLIAARVMAGLTAVEAAERMGYENSTQLSLIESGNRKVPDDWQWLKRASQVYAVSLDFLMGMSPHTEFDAKVSRQYALLRRTEELVGGVAAQIATALIAFTAEGECSSAEFERLGGAVVRVDETLTRLRDKFGFDDAPGGAPLVAAVEALNDAAEPVRRRLRKRRTLEGYMDDVRAGRLPVIEHLAARYSAEGLRAEVLGESLDKENA